MEMLVRLTGRVKWFNSCTGFGLIQADQGEAVYVRSSAIQGQEFRSLEEGQAVEFEIAQGPAGPQAERVVGIDPVPE
jgi:CspA family cold shock protein